MTNGLRCFCSPNHLCWAAHAGLPGPPYEWPTYTDRAPGSASMPAYRARLLDGRGFINRYPSSEAGGQLPLADRPRGTVKLVSDQCS
jgi:hypothetical protein